MRLRVKRDECGDPIIPGQRGHIYEHNHTMLGMLFMPCRPRLWANAKRKLLAAGFVIRQDEDEEGTALLDPFNPAQVQLALKLVGAKPKRIASAAQLEALRKAKTARQISRIQRAEVGVAV